jgi:hypothetical protein
MPRIGGRYVDEDEYANLKAEAAREDYEDRLEGEGWTCMECGELWLPCWRRATRTDPAYPQQDYCPSCGGDPVCGEWGVPLGARAAREAREPGV